MSRFSSNEIDVIERKEEIDVNVTRTWQDINDYYELDRCTEWIKEHKLSKVIKQIMQLLYSFILLLPKEQCALYFPLGGPKFHRLYVM